MSDMSYQRADGSRSSQPVSEEFPLPVRSREDGATLTGSQKTMTGASAPLVSANAARLSVFVSNPSTNDDAAVHPVGGAAAPDNGIPLGPGEKLSITGKAAQSAMTAFGTNGQVLFVLEGV